jgi:hypothetical protein|tara:strand:- start:204 stop:332 length:129 start_codon:yes stop_codon:yes gene_type:complete
MPITWINGFILSSIIYFKNNVIGDRITFEEAIRRKLSRFPDL